MTTQRTVLVPPERLVRWFENFAARHGPGQYSSSDGCLACRADDGSVVRAALPFGRQYDGPPGVAAFADAATVPARWGVLLVRKGGFAVAALDGERTLTSKVGRRHVQGRTKAGGQSQQRFARRRENQAREAYGAAADHAYRILVQAVEPPAALVCGGDHRAVEVVLSDARLSPLSAVRVEPWLAAPDPRREVLVQAVLDGRSARIHLTDRP